MEGNTADDALMVDQGWISVLDCGSKNPYIGSVGYDARICCILSFPKGPLGMQGGRQDALQKTTLLLLNHAF